MILLHELHFVWSKNRYSPELAEQRAIADQQEFLLLQGTSARFLNRKTNSPEFAATLFAPDQQSVPIPVHEGFRSLPAFPAAQAQSAALQASPVNPVVAAFQAADPFIQPAFPTDPYAQPPAPYSQPPAPYTQPAAPYAQPPAPYQQPVIDPYSSYGASPYQVWLKPIHNKTRRGVWIRFEFEALSNCTCDKHPYCQIQQRHFIVTMITCYWIIKQFKFSFRQWLMQILLFVVVLVCLQCDQ